MRVAVFIADGDLSNVFSRATWVLLQDAMAETCFTSSRYILFDKAARSCGTAN